MKSKIVLTLGIVYILTACSKDDSVPVVEEVEEFSSITSLSATSNENDGSISVAFEVNSIVGAEEFWIVVAKLASAGNVSAASVAALSDSQITKVQPSGLSYSVTVGASKSDTDGDILAKGIEYVVFVFESGGSVLSSASSAISAPLDQFESVSSFVVTEVTSGNEQSTLNVGFTANSIEGVDEFWVIVAKNSPDNELTNAHILGLSEEQYTVVAPLGLTYDVVIDNGQTDTDGDIILNIHTYRAYVFATGVEVLSSQSSPANFTQIEVFSSLVGVWVHDIANDQNASDLRVVFDVNSITGVQDFLVFLSEENSSTSITPAFLDALNTSHYTSVSFVADEETYNVPLEADQMDIDGGTFTHGNLYVVHVYSPELGVVASSTEAYLLSDNKVYSGGYTGRWDDNLFQNIPISSLLQHTSGDEYSGPAYISPNYTPTWGGDGTFTMDIVDGVITAFLYDQDLPNYMGGCPGTYTGTGTIDADFNVTIDFTGDDCDGHHEPGTILLERDWKN